MRVKRLKAFSQEPIDISHLSPAAQKKVIEKERKKIQLDQKISDTQDSIRESKSRANMSIEDNAKLGAYEMQKNPLASTASGIGGAVLTGKLTDTALTVASGLMPGMGSGATEAIRMGARMAGGTLAPAITELTGKAIGAIKGLTAERAAKRKEKKLKRLMKKRERLEE